MRTEDRKWFCEVCFSLCAAYTKFVGDTKLRSKYHKLHSSDFAQAGKADRNTKRFTLQIFPKLAIQNPPVGPEVRSSGQKWT